MRVQLFSRIRSLISFMVVMLLLSSMPLSGKTPRSLAASQAGATVQGQVVVNSQFVPDAYVWIARKDAQGAIDPSSQQYTFSDQQGRFSFSNVAVGNYTMDVTPYFCGSADALPLTGYTFTVATTNPVNLNITLTTPRKHIEGNISLSGSPVGNADVIAYNTASQDYACAISAPSGQYRVRAGPGDWEVSVSRTAGAQWMFTDPAPVVHFADDTTQETFTQALKVAPTTGYLKGRVLIPEDIIPGATMPLTIPQSQGPINYDVSINASDDANHTYTYNFLSATGTFSIPVVAGQYAISVELNDSTYPDYGGPADVIEQVGAGTVDVGDITLLKRNSSITGMVTTPNPSDPNQPIPIANAIVEAYQSGGQMENTHTGSDGRYLLRVSAGDWDMYVFPPSGSDYLDFGAPQTVSTTANQTSTLSFSLQQAAAQISGTLVDNQGNPLTNVNAWAYARTDDGSSWNVVGGAQVTNGQFTLNVPAGSLRVGVFLPPDSPYSLKSESISPAALAKQLAASQSLSTAAMAGLERAPYERSVSVPPAGISPAAAKLVTITLVHNDASIHGTLLDQNGSPVEGVSGVILADPIDPNGTWQQASLNANGTFDLAVSAAASPTWRLSYYLDTDMYAAYPSAPISVQIASNESKQQDLSTFKLDGVIHGTVRDDNNNVVPGAYVWARGTNFEQYAATDPQGAYTLYVPLKDGTKFASYTVGTALPCGDGAVCLLDADPVVVTLGQAAQGALLISPQDQTTDLVVSRNGLSVTVRGVLTLDNDIKPVGAKITFKPTPGTKGTTTTTSGGNYSVNITVPTGKPSVRYELTGSYRTDTGQCYCHINATGTGLKIPANLSNAAGGLPTPMAIQGPDLNMHVTAQLPHSVSGVFKIDDGGSFTLSDGAQVQIPANAVPVSQGETQVRITITPEIGLEPTDLYDTAAYYGYAITLFEADSGKQISQPLLSDALITLRYNQGELLGLGATESQLRAANFSADRWQPANSAIVSPDLNKITVSTSTLGIWSLVRPQGSNQLYLPLARR
jgi:hypothetical protein